MQDERPIIQSSNIAEYLDDSFPNPQPQREWMQEEQEFLFRLIVLISFKSDEPWICGWAFPLADISVVRSAHRIHYLERKTLYDGLPA